MWLEFSHDFIPRAVSIKIGNFCPSERIRETPEEWYQQNLQMTEASSQKFDFSFQGNGKHITSQPVTKTRSLRTGHSTFTFVMLSFMQMTQLTSTFMSSKWKSPWRVKKKKKKPVSSWVWWRVWLLHLQGTLWPMLRVWCRELWMSRVSELGWGQLTCEPPGEVLVFAWKRLGVPEAPLASTH